MAGPLEGIRIIEMAGIGPAPFAGMMLADMGAEVLRIERKTGASPLPLDPAKDITNRSKASLLLDLKDPHAVDYLCSVVKAADGLMEGFRPGVMERLGLGPDRLLQENPQLVYGRMTGWGQRGPRAQTAGHDINYISIAGALGSFGPHDGPPSLPLNLLGDFGGGAMFLVSGMLAALLHAQKTGDGQVVDAAMTDGVAALMAPTYSFDAMGLWTGARGTNFLDGSAPFYSLYETSDGLHMAVGCLEPQFYAEFIRILGVASHPAVASQYDRRRWPEMRTVFADAFKSDSQQDWAQRFDGTDACVTPVLDYRSAQADAHNQHRKAFISADGLTQPAPAPRFSATPSNDPAPPCSPGVGGEAMLDRWGVTPP